jgi:hypothetical protein
MLSDRSFDMSSTARSLLIIARREVTLLDGKPEALIEKPSCMRIGIVSSGS